MRVCFNTFDTHADEDNIIDIESIAFKKTKDKRINIQINIVDPRVIIGELGETGQISLDILGVIFTKNVVISVIYAYILDETEINNIRYSYIFDFVTE